MAEIYLTQEIQNEDGYIDNVVDQIKAIPKGEDLEMSVTCEGGNTFQGARLHRAIMEHEGNTKFIGIGLAASMGAVLMSAFDEVEFDEDLDIMLHKAHIPDVPEDELDSEQFDILNKFNKRAYSKMLSRGVDESFLNEVFLSKETKDYWLTAKEAESLGIGNVIRIERRDSKPFKVAAKLKLNSKMFGKNKKVTRSASLKDGRVVVFKSEKETVAKGDVLELIGSSELLTGKIELENNLVLNMGEGNEVADVEEIEEPVDEVDEEQVADLMQRVADLEKALSEMIGGEPSEEDAEAKAKTEADEAEAKAEDDEEMKNLKDKVEAMAKSVEDTMANLKTNFKLEKVNNKHEQQKDGLQHLTATERHAYDLKEIVNSTKNKIK